MFLMYFNMQIVRQFSENLQIFRLDIWPRVWYTITMVGEIGLPEFNTSQPSQGYIAFVLFAIFVL